MNADLRDRALAAYVWRHASFMAVETDAKGRVASMNAYAVRLFGSEVQGRPLLELVSALSAPASFEEFCTQARSPQPMSFSSQNDEVVSLFVTAVPVDSGYLVCGQRDEQELARLQKNLFHMSSHLNGLARDLHQANTRLERGNAAKNAFLATAANDLRGPMEGLHAYCSGLIEDMDKLKLQDMNEFLMLTKNASQYVLGIVGDLLDMSSSGLGRPGMEMRRADLHEIAANCLRLAALLAKDKDVDIVFFFEKKTCMVSCDPDKIEQAINNLLAHALKSAPPRGKVELRMELKDEDVVVSVCDDGPGLDEAERKRVFEPFETVGSAAADGEKCPSLGLAIAGKIVHGHGGRIWVESARGQGTCFRFTLPLAP